MWLYLLALVICVVYGFIAVRISVAQWRGSLTAGIPMYRGVPAGGTDRQLVGMRRAYLPTGLACLFLAVVILFGMLGLYNPGRLTVAWAVVVSVALAGLVFFGGCSACIVWFNRPKFLVPPNRRDQASAFADWRSERNAARRL